MVDGFRNHSRVLAKSEGSAGICRAESGAKLPAMEPWRSLLKQLAEELEKQSARLQEGMFQRKSAAPASVSLFGKKSHRFAHVCWPFSKVSPVFFVLSTNLHFFGQRQFYKMFQQYCGWTKSISHHRSDTQWIDAIRNANANKRYGFNHGFLCGVVCGFATSHRRCLKMFA